MNYDVIVIGGGPAGILAAINAKKYVEKVLLIEKNEALGEKLLITGGGRCNFTNNSSLDEFIANIPGNGNFLRSTLSQFSNIDLINFVEENLKLKIKVEDEGRIFPVLNKAEPFVKFLEKYIVDCNVEIIYETVLKELVIENSRVIGVLVNNGRLINGDTIILATGGLSYPETGSTGDGYQIAEMLGHKINELFPSSVPLISNDLVIQSKELQGISLKNIKLYLYDDSNKCIKKVLGDIIFTHYGLSGPAILKISRYVGILFNKNKKVSKKLLIDILPNNSEEELILRINGLVILNRNKYIYNGLKDILPEKLINYIINENGLSLKKMNELTLRDIKKIINNIKNFKINISGTRSITEAIVTGGGIDIKQVNPKTLESKLVSGLFFAGEILDVDANTGGYNLQIAFSMGHVAGTSAGKFNQKNE